MSRAQAYETLIRKGLNEKGTEPVAQALGVDKATVSRLQSDHLAKFCGLLDTLGLKVTPQSYKCYPAEEVDMLLKMAKRYMASMESPQELEWGDE